MNKNGSALLLLWYSCSMIVRHKMACLYCLSFTFTTKTTIALISWMLTPGYYNVKNKLSCNQTFSCLVQLVHLLLFITRKYAFICVKR